MRQYNGIADAADAARLFFLVNQDSLPEHVREKLTPVSGTGASPVDLIVNFVESAYANAEAFGKEGQEIAAGLASLIDREGFHGRLDGRAAAMSLALRRVSGEKAPNGGWPAKADDPEPKADFEEQKVSEEPSE